MSEKYERVGVHDPQDEKSGDERADQERRSAMTAARASGGADGVFMVELTEPTDLCYKEDEWNG